ncbi:hypothetical protein GGI21_006704, partial [Coemansia aciculifera]
LVRKLAQRQALEVVSWTDYCGCSAIKLATDSGLLGVVDVLQQAAASSLPENNERAESSASTVSLDSTSGLVPPRGGGCDRYEAAARRAAGLLSAATENMRRDHQQQRRAVDADTEYAAQLLLELRTERDAACADAEAYAAVAQQCSAARHIEAALRRRVEQTVELQHVARSAKKLVHQETEEEVEDSSSPVSSGLSELRAEYAMLRARAVAFERSSRELGREYAELAGVVRPWATAGGDEADDTAALSVVLQAEEQRLHKLERVVAAACGDLSLDRVRTVVGPVLSVLNSGATK